MFRSALNRALKLQRLKSNPVATTKAVQYKRREGACLNAEQATAFVSAARAAEDRYADLWIVLLGLGLRRDEAPGFKPEDIEMEARRLVVNRSRSRVKLPGRKEGSGIEKPPKTDKSRWSLPLPLPVFDTRARQTQRRDTEREQAGKLWQNAPYLFTTPLGGAVHGAEINRALNDACDRANLTHIRVHDLRRSCGTCLGSQGMPLCVVMDILGHTHITTAKR